MARPRIVKSEFAARLREARGELGIEEIVASCEVAASTYAAYERGDTTPDAGFIGKFIKRTGADPWRLLTGTPAPKSDREEVFSGEVALVDRFKLQVSAGGGSSDVALPTTPMAFGSAWLRRNGIKPDEVSVLEVKGDSMFPLLHDGDPIIVNKRKSRPVDGKVYVIVRPDLVQVKKVVTLQRRFELLSENSAYPTERIDFREAPEPEFFKVRWFSHFLE